LTFDSYVLNGTPYTQADEVFLQWFIGFLKQKVLYNGRNNENNGFKLPSIRKIALMYKS
jgi:hypothetical protein